MKMRGRGNCPLKSCALAVAQLCALLIIHSRRLHLGPTLDASIQFPRPFFCMVCACCPFVCCALCGFCVGFEGEFSSHLGYVYWDHCAHSTNHTYILSGIWAAVVSQFRLKMRQLFSQISIPTALGYGSQTWTYSSLVPGAWGPCAYASGAAADRVACGSPEARAKFWRRLCEWTGGNHETWNAHLGLHGGAVAYRQTVRLCLLQVDVTSR